MISGEVPLAFNPPVAFLVEKSILEENAKLVSNGAIAVSIMEMKARRYVVTDSYSLRQTNWEPEVEKMDPSLFSKLKDAVLKNINFFKPHIHILERRVGADPAFTLGFRLITTSAVQALVCHQQFFEMNKEYSLGLFTLYHVSDLKFDVGELGIIHDPWLVINFESKEIIFIGVSCLSQIKDALFSVLSSLLPDHGVMPLKSAGFLLHKKQESIFLGQPELYLPFLKAQDSSHFATQGELGLSPHGIFPLTCGQELKASDIAQNIKQLNFGTILENFQINLQTRQIAWAEDRKKEKGKIFFPHWPLPLLENAFLEQKPRFLFLFIHDYCGVIPAISKLNLEQALFFLRSDLVENPLLLRRRADYENLLKLRLENGSVNIWLVNTGYYGGSASIGKKYPTRFLKQCIEVIESLQDNEMELELSLDPIFLYHVPRRISGVDLRLLNPMKLWSDEEKYLKEALGLRLEIESVMKKVKIKRESSFQLPF